MAKSKNEKKIPPCVVEEVNFCRGCPGWAFMLEAQKSGKGLWRKLPVHCSVTGVTILPIKKK